MTGTRVRLLLALAIFLGWLSYLGYAALNKNRGPIVSAARVAVAERFVVADVAAGPDGKLLPHVRGTEVGGPQPVRFEGEVANLAEAAGFAGPGSYLLLLESDGDEWRLVSLPRSPGYDHPVADRPTLYPWTPDVQGQFAQLKP